MFTEEINTLKSMNVRDLIRQGITLGQVISGALILWKVMMFVLMTESPIVVVLSGSMEPGYFRGDVLFLNMWEDPITVGDVVVYSLEGKDIPIVHRVQRVHEEAVTGNVYILTKGDNNPGDDRGLYNSGQEWLTPKNIMGRPRSYVPDAGMLTIWMAEHSWVQFLVIAGLIFFTLTGKE